MQALGHYSEAGPKHRPNTSTVPDGTLILTVGPPQSHNEKGLISLRNVLLENIPHFRSFAAALAATSVSHKPVGVRYLPGCPTLDLSHAECKLRDVTVFPVLSSLLTVSTLASLQLELPLFGAESLPALTAPSLTSLTLQGELPCTYQFLAALYAPALGTLGIHFHRNQWDKLDTLDDPMRDRAYTLPLLSRSFPALRTLKMEERELRPRWSDVSLTCALFPLLCIPTLEDVEVRFDASPLWVGDGDVAQLAASWPYVRRLVLTCTNTANRCASFGALGHLAAGCRDLRELVLPRLRLDDSDTLARAGSQTSTGSSTAHPLRSLSVACPTSGTASGDRCVALGRELDALFPHLEPDMQTLSAKSADGHPSDWYMLWLGVQSAKIARTTRSAQQRLHSGHHRTSCL
ncbi:hypothetical protein C8Q80DRAFT_1111288 [Daedaleopsis nitida]|nr:hypothetical protein C8Q80DRAFT_1111288 [Daedaleopsis nitida]